MVVFLSLIDLIVLSAESIRREAPNLGALHSVTVVVSTRPCRPRGVCLEISNLMDPACCVTDFATQAATDWQGGSHLEEAMSLCLPSILSCSKQGHLHQSCFLPWGSMSATAKQNY